MCPHQDSPHMYRSLSAEDTAHDIYKGLKQGRDVVVPGLVNKLYTYLFSQILPSAAVGAITEVSEQFTEYDMDVHILIVIYVMLSFPSSCNQYFSWCFSNTPPSLIFVALYLSLCLPVCLPLSIQILLPCLTLLYRLHGVLHRSGCLS